MKTWHHVSPVTGLGICQAQSPDKCKFGADNHFNAKAAERIKTGRTSNYQEYEAMRSHQLATGQEVAEEKLPPTATAPTPAAMANSRPPAPTPPVKRPNGFPTNHQRPRVGDEILYHAEIGFPKNFMPPKGRFELEWGRHALDEAAKDRYGKVPTPKTLLVDKMKIIELGVQNGKVSKILYRGTLACATCRENETPQANCNHPKRDMCIVVIPKPNQPWYVKTVWINLQSDKHRTLDATKYQKPE